MGLDTVELAMAIEEEFGVEIQNEDAERMTLVGDVYDWLRIKLNSTTAAECLTQQIFYKLRRSLIQNYGVNRRSIKLDSVMTDLMTVEEVEAGWPFIELFLELKTPPFKKANQFLGWKLKDRMLTVRQLVYGLITLNKDKLVLASNSDEEIWRRLKAVFIMQLNVKLEDVVLEASITRDLGAD